MKLINLTIISIILSTQVYASSGQNSVSMDGIFSDFKQIRFNGTLVEELGDPRDARSFKMEIRSQDQDNPQNNLFKVLYAVDDGVACNSIYSLGHEIGDDQNKNVAYLQNEDELGNSNCIEEILVEYKEESKNIIIGLDQNYIFKGAPENSYDEDSMEYPHILNENNEDQMLVSIDLWKRKGVDADKNITSQKCAYEVFLSSDDDSIVRPLNKFAYSSVVAGALRQVKYYTGGVILFMGTIAGTTIAAGSAAATPLFLLHFSELYLVY